MKCAEMCYLGVDRMKDLLCFRKMITPSIIQFLFWVMVLASVVMFVCDLFRKEYFIAVQVIILGPLVARVVAEMILVVFRIYDALVHISKKESL